MARCLATTQLVVSFSFVACSINLGVPNEARIECETTADCPRGFVCRESIGTCVDAEGLEDVAPPELATEPQVHPTLAAAGTEVVIQMEVTKPLVHPPLLVVDTRTTSVELSPAQLGGLTFEYRYTVSGDEPEGLARLYTDLVDSAGNLVRGVAVGAFTIDLTPPNVLSADLAYVPPPHSPLQIVSAATVGSLVRVSFTPDEPLHATVSPTLRATHAPYALDLEVIEHTESKVIFEVVVPHNAPDGDYALTLGWADEASNVGTIATFPVSLPTLTVKTLAPAPPQVDGSGAVVFTRRPWGSGQSPTAPAVMTLHASPTAVDVCTAFGAHQPCEPCGTLARPCPWLIAYDRADIASAAELGRAQLDPNGGAEPFDVGRQDRPEIFVAVVDGAGNPSDADETTSGAQASRVREIVWHANLARKRAGSTFENPHTLLAVPRFRDALAQRGAAELDASTGVDVNGSGYATTPVASSWRRHSAIVPAWANRVLYDSRRGVALTYERVCCQTQRYYTAEWNGYAWAEVIPTDPEGDDNPPPNSAGIPGYDERRGRALWWVASAGGQMWSWNGVSWRRLGVVDPEGDGNPTIHTGTRMVYDDRRGVMVLFGGTHYSGGVLSNQTWEWNGTSWLLRTPQDPEQDDEPPARTNHAVVFDRHTGHTLIVGGETDVGIAEDIWRWDGIRWEALSPTPGPDGNPPATAQVVAAFDPRSWSVILYDSLNAQTWEWSGSAWQRLAIVDPEGDGSPGAEAYSLFYSGARGRLVLMGVNPAAHGWELEGSAWVRLAPDPELDGDPLFRKPGMTYRMDALAHDATRGVTVLFGGSSGAETWEWDGRSWVERAPLDPEADGNPSARLGHGMAYDPLRQRTVLFGGSTGGNETWLWDGSSWELQTPSTIPPSAMGVTLHWHTWLGAVMLLQPSSTTLWAWNGANWQSFAATDPEGDGNPTGVTVSAIAYDEDEDVVVSYGGGGSSEPFTSHNQTWEWNGSSWLNVTPTASAPDHDPGARRGASLFFDPWRSNRYLFAGASLAPGGTGSYVPTRYANLWRWDMDAWRRVSVVDPEGDGAPAPRYLQAATLDLDRRGLLVAGGQIAGSTPNSTDVDLDTWQLDLGHHAHPGHVATFDFAASGAAPDVQLTTVELVWSAGGTGGAVHGARLLIWDEGAFVELDAHSASAQEPAALGWSSSHGPSLPRLFAGERRQLTFAVVPVEPGGDIATDYLEAITTYRLP